MSVKTTSSPHDEPVYETQFDPNSTIEASTAVVLALEAVGASDASSELPLLVESIDPDALNSFCSRADGDSDWEVSFEHADRNVSIRADGRIRIESASVD